jgi:hypothetical protein
MVAHDAARLRALACLLLTSAASASEGGGGAPACTCMSEPQSCDDGTTSVGGCGCADEFSSWCLNSASPCAKPYSGELEASYREGYAAMASQYQGTADEAWFLSNVPDVIEEESGEVKAEASKTAVV